MADDCSCCREELARLTEENAALRRAALAFGSLAERLNLALQEERNLRQRATTGRETTDAVNRALAYGRTVECRAEGFPGSKSFLGGAIR